MYSLDQTHTIDVEKKIQQTEFKLSPKSARKISLPVLHCAEHSLSPFYHVSGGPRRKSFPPSLRKFPCLSNLALPPKTNNNHKNKK